MIKSSSFIAYSAVKLTEITDITNKLTEYIVNTLAFLLNSYSIAWLAYVYLFINPTKLYQHIGNVYRFRLDIAMKCTVAIYANSNLRYHFYQHEVSQSKSLIHKINTIKLKRFYDTFS